MTANTRQTRAARRRRGTIWKTGSTRNPAIIRVRWFGRWRSSIFSAGSAARSRSRICICCSKLPKPTVSRLAAVLERYGYLIRREQTYMLGPKLFELGSLFARQDGLVEISRATARARHDGDVARRRVLGCCCRRISSTWLSFRRRARSTTSPMWAALRRPMPLGSARLCLRDSSDGRLEVVLPQLALKPYTPNTMSTQPSFARS